MKVAQEELEAVLILRLDAHRGTAHVRVARQIQVACVGEGRK